MSDKTIYENCLGAHRNPNCLLELHVLSHEVAAAPSGLSMLSLLISRRTLAPVFLGGTGR